MANPLVHALVSQGTVGRTHRQPEGGCGPPPESLPVAPNRSQDPLGWDVSTPVAKPWEEQTISGARRHRRRRFLWWLRWAVEAKGETHGTLTDWSDGHVTDPWDFCGPVPGRRRAV